MSKHILFDCDGVLIDTEIVAAEVVSNWLNTQSMRITVDEFIHQFTGKTFTDIINILKSDGKLANSLDTLSIVPELDGQIKAKMRPIDGVNEMLATVKTPVSAVSNSAADYVAQALEMLNVHQQFEGRIFSAEMVERGKPSPLVYELALKQVGLDKDDVVVVEDSASGMMAAKAAGLYTIGFLGGSHIREGHGERLKSFGADALAKNYEELLQLLP